MSLDHYRKGLDRNEANYAPLTPVSFLERTAQIFPDYISVIGTQREYTWNDTFARCCAFASSLTKHGIKAGDTVSILAPNINAIYEAHFAVPMIGAVLNPINTRLDPKTIGFILDHSDSKMLFVDTELMPAAKEALKILNKDLPLIYIDDDPEFAPNSYGEKSYEDFLADGDRTKIDFKLDSEWHPISLLYTSGTTGNPKGVVIHHRGAYLNSVGNQLVWYMRKHPVYLWTLPMFHCNGWCFPWTMAALAGTNVCLRKVIGKKIFDLIDRHKVTHFCGAPIVLNMLIEEGRKVAHRVEIMTAASPPPATVLQQIEEQGFNITHVYGLTEVYGPAVVCEWKKEWDDMDSVSRAGLKSRQGVRYPGLADMKVVNKETNRPVAMDGKELGEVYMRGDIVMMGYYKNEKATNEAFEGGWFHTGDLGVVYPDGYIQLKDRSKDIIISGGENISTIELEGILVQHPDIVDAAVVGLPDEKWGEVPCAFITPRNNSELDDEGVKEFCRENMAGFKIPKKFIFGEIEKTSTGKVQKAWLRKKAQEFFK